ncbi:trypsin-like serine protease with C-terminal PDZ domain [Thermobacillus composti KWC4]|uniref:Trypsin-like serine protease with C-terminal PDZ domain n=1 Tax=Thermobacillus composti (strain DSM 18247 / JCM 13945 / KWC4) TaxID=717605 RepID=L0EHZ2_THECK|nr:trypsin-like peptidase domain-containing protein [Thermobacillus composti]AGA58790.1 trypsin-like serine protease with C-terminal PDZ domain [Thermobacillus composti KWC4]
MDDKNNVNRPYDDFFRRPEERSGLNGRAGEEGSGAADGGAADAAGGTAAKPVYYYSYGPFRSGGTDRDASDAEPVIRHEAAAAERIDAGTAARPAPAVRTWTVRERRRGSWWAPVAAFLAGILLTGSLMIASDRLNLFTGSDQALAQSPSAGGAANPGAAPEGSTAAGSSGGKVSNAVDLVRPNNIAKIVEQSSPAVVKIETYVKTRSRSGNSLFDDPFFRQFFGDSYRIPTDDEGSQQLRPSGLGSGFFFDKEGYILTNQHVVGGADQIMVTVIGYDEPFEAELLGSSYDLDLAVLKIKGDKDFPTLPLGDSDTINVGEWVVAIGNPNGFDHTVTVGVLSAKERPITIQDTEGTRQYQHLLQTDASINPGNSGGPLINLAGEVIGINTAVSTTAQGIGFAIPTSTIVGVLDTLKENKPVPQPFIGATLADITEQAASQLGLDNTKGSIVVNILYNSPAYKADLRQYDVIVGMDGKKYDTKEDLIKAIQNKKVGEKAVLDVIRGGNQVQITVEIGDKNDFNVQ